MSNMSLLPAPQMSADVERNLVELAEQRMLAPARQAGHEMRLVGATVLPQGQTITQTAHGTWLFVDQADDPTATEYKGRIPVPDDQIPRLIEIGHYGFRPDFVCVGHELPENYRIGDPIPQLVPPPRELRELDERLTHILTKLMRLFFKIVRTILAAAAGAPVAVAAGLTGLDPIIFGGVKHPDLPIVMWCAIAQWEWE
jgi:hypothetical protein